MNGKSPLSFLTLSIYRLPLWLWMVFILFVQQAYSKRWVCDDAFISFRYAYHAAIGNGLVFNPGEYVEGYTNFLWTLLLVIPEYLQISTLQVACLLGIVCAFASLVTLAQFSHKQNLYFAPLALACHSHFLLFATSGLETSLFTCLLFGGACLLFHSAKKRTALFLLALACLTRPEGFLYFYLYSLSHFFLSSEKSGGSLRRRRPLIATSAPR